MNKTPEEIEQDFCSIITAPSGQDARVSEIDKIVAKNCAKYLQEYATQCQADNEEQVFTKQETIDLAWWLVDNKGKYSNDRLAHFEGHYLEQWINLTTLNKH